MVEVAAFVLEPEEGQIAALRKGGTGVLSRPVAGIVDTVVVHVQRGKGLRDEGIESALAEESA